jgi:hypothetical protein
VYPRFAYHCCLFYYAVATNTKDTRMELQKVLVSRWQDVKLVPGINCGIMIHVMVPFILSQMMESLRICV